MVSWWVLAFAVVFPLAQVPLVLWIGRYFALDDEEPATPEVRELWQEGHPTGGDRTGEEFGEYQPDAEAHDLPEVPGGPDGSRAATDDGPSTRHCPGCGAANDAGFSFCGECAAALE